MPRFPNQEQIISAFRQTKARLEVQQPYNIGKAQSPSLIEKGGSGGIFKSAGNNDTLLNKDTAGVFFKYLLLQGLGTGEAGYWRERWKQDKNIPLRERLHGLLRDIQSMLKTATDIPEQGLFKCNVSNLLLPNYRLQHGRIIDLAVEAVLSEPLAPEVYIEFAPIASQKLGLILPGNWQHALIFSSPYFFSHEFYPLAVDAYVHDAELFGESRINVLGAHIDWLTEDGFLKRILYLDFAAGQLVESDLEMPIQPDSVQFLCLGQQEQGIHQALAQRFTCLQLNPVSISSLADNKVATLEGWVALGLEVPIFQEVVVGDFETVLGFLDRFAEIVVKPNAATEGELVAYFARNNPESRSALLYHLQQCWKQGAAIVQQRRDGVCYRDPDIGKQQTLALRLNISGNADNRYFLESGFVQLGADLQHPAACGRDGRIVGFDEIQANLRTRTTDPSKSVSLDAKVWSGIRTQAEQAASLFQNLCLLGLDVLLDLDDSGKIIPVFLEANPRPAGLCHSRLFAEDPFKPADIGVSLKLWDNFNVT